MEFPSKDVFDTAINDFLDECKNKVRKVSNDFKESTELLKELKEKFM